MNATAISIWRELHEVQKYRSEEYAAMLDNKRYFQQ